MPTLQKACKSQPKIVVAAKNMRKACKNMPTLQNARGKPAKNLSPRPKGMRKARRKHADGAKACEKLAKTADAAKTCKKPCKNLSPRKNACEKPAKCMPTLQKVCKKPAKTCRHRKNACEKLAKTRRCCNKLAISPQKLVPAAKTLAKSPQKHACYVETDFHAIRDVRFNGFYVTSV
jgi:hypothetical protein